MTDAIDRTGVHAVGDEDAESRPGALWDGDTGTLAYDVRRALARLVQGPYLDATHHREMWNALIGAQDVVRSRLADLFLELHVDRDRGVAFVRNARSQAVAVPTVVRTQPMTFIDTVVVLHLRSLLLQAQARGEAVLVDREEIVDAVAVYRPHVSSDEAGFAKRVRAAVAKMEKASVLLKTDVEDRFRVSPILELVFTAEEVAHVQAQYERMLATGSQTGGHDDEGDADDV